MRDYEEMAKGFLDRHSSLNYDQLVRLIKSAAALGWEHGMTDAAGICTDRAEIWNKIKAINSKEPQYRWAEATLIAALIDMAKSRSK